MICSCTIVRSSIAESDICPWVYSPARSSIRFFTLEWMMLILCLLLYYVNGLHLLCTREIHGKIVLKPIELTTKHSHAHTHTLDHNNHVSMNFEFKYTSMQSRDKLIHWYVRSFVWFITLPPVVVDIRLTYIRHLPLSHRRRIRLRPLKGKIVS